MVVVVEAGLSEVHLIHHLLVLACLDRSCCIPVCINLVLSLERHWLLELGPSLFLPFPGPLPSHQQDAMVCEPRPLSRY